MTLRCLPRIQQSKKYVRNKLLLSSYPSDPSTGIQPNCTASLPLMLHSGQLLLKTTIHSARLISDATEAPSVAIALETTSIGAPPMPASIAPAFSLVGAAVGTRCWPEGNFGQLWKRRVLACWYQRFVLGLWRNCSEDWRGRGVAGLRPRWRCSPETPS